MNNIGYVSRLIRTMPYARRLIRWNRTGKRNETKRGGKERAETAIELMICLARVHLKFYFKWIFCGFPF